MRRFETVVPPAEVMRASKRRTPGMGWRDNRVVSVIGQTDGPVHDAIVENLQLLRRLSNEEIVLDAPSFETNVFVLIGERGHSDFATDVMSAITAKKERLKKLKKGFDGFYSSKGGFYCEIETDWKSSLADQRVTGAYIFFDQDVEVFENFESIVRFLLIYCVAPFQPLHGEPTSILTAGNYSAPWNCVDEIVIRLLLDNGLGPTMPRESFLQRARSKAQQLIDEPDGEPLVCLDE